MLLNFFTNVVYNIEPDGKINIIKLNYVKPSVDEYLAVKWLNF